MTLPLTATVWGILSSAPQPDRKRKVTTPTPSRRELEQRNIMAVFQKDGDFLVMGIVDMDGALLSSEFLRKNSLYLGAPRID
jgi:hypothetical protein